MATDPQSASVAGTLQSLFRYPVKSMGGEEIAACGLSPDGLAGDRDLALIDIENGKVVSAKNPRKWPGLLDFRAASDTRDPTGSAPGAIRITTPDGQVLSCADPGIDAVLSSHLGRQVHLARRGDANMGRIGASSVAGWAPSLEEYWPEDVEGIAHNGIVTDEAMPKGTFFDLAPVHLLTTATLSALRAAHPDGNFDLRRFRPNLVVETPGAEAAFTENGWIGRTVQIGDGVALAISGPCPRCVMTTLEQQDLPRDVGILRAAASRNAAHVGVYATVLRGGVLRRGDTVRVL